MAQRLSRDEQLQALLADTLEIEDEETGDSVTYHGLAWFYPQVKAWTMVCGSAEGSGKPGTALPFNVDALDFVGGSYWSIEEFGLEQATDEQLADAKCFVPGFEPTVLSLHRSVRAMLRIPPTRHVRSSTLELDPFVVDAIVWLERAIPSYVGDVFIAQLVASEARRLISRAQAMMLGSRFHAGRGPCPKCHQVDSVISDEDRAVCINPMCRNRAGERHCWRFHNETWTEVDEPDVRGRGHVDDDTLSRWATEDARSAP